MTAWCFVYISSWLILHSLSNKCARNSSLDEWFYKIKPRLKSPEKNTKTCTTVLWTLTPSRMRNNLFEVETWRDCHSVFSRVCIAWLTEKNTMIGSKNRVCCCFLYIAFFYGWSKYLWYLPHFVCSCYNPLINIPGVISITGICQTPVWDRD